MNQVSNAMTMTSLLLAAPFACQASPGAADKTEVKAEHQGRTVSSLGRRNSGNIFRTSFSRPYRP